MSEFSSNFTFLDNIFHADFLLAGETNIFRGNPKREKRSKEGHTDPERQKLTN